MFLWQKSAERGWVEAYGEIIQAVVRQRRIGTRVLRRRRHAEGRGEGRVERQAGIPFGIGAGDRGVDGRIRRAKIRPDHADEGR